MRRRHVYLDLLKTLAMVCVCMYHFPMIQHTAYARPFGLDVLCLRFVFLSVFLRYTINHRQIMIITLHCPNGVTVFTKCLLGICTYPCIKDYGNCIHI